MQLVLLVTLDYLVLTVQLEHRDYKEIVVHRVILELLEVLDHLALQVLLEQEVQQD